ncbi:MAG: hypothetical protein HN521_00475 [Candidatus Latescibacteria bacterium]|nr:hypothetical protein [Candidatus Latescibacterota bacterium]
MMKSFDTYADLLEWIEQKGYTPRVLGQAPDGAPIVSIKIGGEKGPAIFISAGSHATEQAGVSAATALIEQLETEHPVYILPCRDPIGLNGFSYALSLSIANLPPLNTIDDVNTVLKKHGEILYEKDDTLLVIIGEYGYANKGLYGQFEKGQPFLKSLIGRRIFFPSRQEGIEGTAFCQRAYTLIVSPDAEVLHINRFHDTAWAPVESRCTRTLMAEIQPRLILDLHEHGGDSFWFSARHQQNDEDEMWEKRMADGIIGAVAKSGAALAPEDYLPGSFFSKGERGVYWLNAQTRGEGLNLTDFAARTYGPAFTIETGMRTGFQHRVETSLLAAQTAINIFESRYE